MAHQKPIFFPFGQPANLDAIFDKAKVFLKEQMDQEDAKIKENLDRQRFMDNLSMTRIPRLTNEERQLKVSQYLEKKHNRQWKAIRYIITQIKIPTSEISRRKEGKSLRKICEKLRSKVLHS